MDKVSVIIPVYNLEDNIEVSVQSVLNQTFKNLEIIIVNDGSTDNSLNIINKLKETDERIVVVNQNNSGLSEARNSGLNIATGDYIYFLDGDDYIHPQMMEILLRTQSSNNSDIVFFLSKDVFDYSQFNDNKFKSYNLKSIEVTEFSQQEVIGKLPEQNEVRFEVWNKLYKRSVIGEIRFKPGQIYEDVYFNRVTLLQNIKYIFINLPLHFYLKNRNGNTSSGSFKENRFLVYDETKKWFDDLTNLGFHSEKNKMQISYLIFLFGQFNLAAERNATSEIKNKITREFKNNFNSEIIKNSDISFFKKIFLSFANFNMPVANYLFTILRRGAH